MKPLPLKSPAKLNLFLKVNGKRPDGYHDLTTLFERIDLCDELLFQKNISGKIRIFCQHPHVPKGKTNLVYKAAMLLQNRFSVKSGVDVTITKRIPVAAGLGGGSSNAATTLLGLNILWSLRLNRAQLVSFAKEIGSDVPFFLYRESWAIGTERGDRIKPLKLNARLWQILIVPRLKVYTREIFATLNLKLTKKKADVNILQRALRKNDLPKVGRLLRNDLETAIVQSHPSLIKIKEKLKRFPTLGVLFSGSGPAVFGLVSSKKVALDLKASLCRQYRQVFVVRTN